jgi:flagellar basal body-associated protein FliL
MNTPMVLFKSLQTKGWFQAPGAGDGFEWPILIVVVIIILIVAGVGILICLCMKKEADDERGYRKEEEKEKEKMMEVAKDMENKDEMMM